jgi:hypothetical protein
MAQLFHRSEGPSFGVVARCDAMFVVTTQWGNEEFKPKSFEPAFRAPATSDSDARHTND